jgi:hypothetical protein
MQIMVFDTSSDDWRRVLKYFSANYVVTLTEDGVQKPIPDIETIFQQRDERSLALEVMLPGFTVNSHFFSKDAIELNVLPEDVDSNEKAESVFCLMTDIARLLNKHVYLTPEFSGASSEEIRRLAVCTATPGGASVQCRWNDE